MHAISKDEARLNFEIAELAAETIIEAQFGFYDDNNPSCVAMYQSVFNNLLDERLKKWTLPELVTYLYFQS